MTSRELASTLGCTEQNIQKHTKKAVEASRGYITLGGVDYPFVVSSGVHGKAYSYETPETLATPRKRRVNALKLEDFAKIKHIDITLGKTKVEDKLLIIALLRASNCSIEAIVKSLVAHHYSDEFDAKKVKSTVKKITRWVEAFKSAGKKALEDKRGNNGEFRVLDEALLRESIINAMKNTNRTGFEAVHRYYSSKLAHEKGLKIFDCEKVCSYSSIVSGVRKVLKGDAYLKDFVNKGWDALLQAYPVGLRDVVYPNQEWQVDATKFDFMVKTASGEIKRLNYTIAIDVFTGAFVGRFTDTLNSYDQVFTLLDGVEKMGLPELVKLDNGRDYTSEHYQATLELMGAGVSFAKVGQGRQKGKVERFFGWFQQAISLLPGYIGNDVDQRTKIENQTASKIEVRTGKATRIKENRLLSVDEMSQILENLADKYSKGYKEHEAFRISDEALEALRGGIGKKSLRTLQESGISYNGKTFTGADLWLGGLKKGDKVTVVEVFEDITTIKVYLDDKYIGIARDTDLGAEAMSIAKHKESVKAYNKGVIAPLGKEIKKAQLEGEKLQDELASELLRYAPTYTKSVSHISPKIKTTKQSNFSSSPASSSDLDSLYDLMKSVS